MSTIRAAAVESKGDALRILRDRRNDFRALGVDRIGLFGSFVRGDQNENSDVDVLVDFREGEATFDHFMDLCFMLEEALGRKVDVVTEKYLSPYIGPHILREVEYVSLDD